MVIPKTRGSDWGCRQLWLVTNPFPGDSCAASPRWEGEFWERAGSYLDVLPPWHWRSMPGWYLLNKAPCDLQPEEKIPNLKWQLVSSLSLVFRQDISPVNKEKGVLSTSTRMGWRLWLFTALLSTGWRMNKGWSLDTDNFLPRKGVAIYVPGWKLAYVLDQWKFLVVTLGFCMHFQATYP